MVVNDAPALALALASEANEANDAPALASEANMPMLARLTMPLPLLARLTCPR